MIRRVLSLLSALLLINYGCGLDLDTIRPIHESKYWRDTHPALGKLLDSSELAYRTIGGKVNAASRVTGGAIATSNQFPYQAALVITLPSEQSFCGGSLISNNFVLTAAHCLDTATMATVLFGAHDVSLPSESTRAIQLIMPRNFNMHENYNSTQYQNDIALLRLNSPVQTNSVISIISLPRLSQVDTTFAGSQAVISGWGRYLDTVDALSEQLRFVNLSVLANSGCTPFFGAAVTDMKVCSAGTGRVGPCGGDSGGPLVVEDSGLKVQVGLVSFSVGFGCQLGWPTVHTRVSKYLDWIGRHTDVTLRA